MVLRRWWLVLALLVSVGVNVGVLATLTIARLTAGPPPAAGEGPRAGEAGSEDTGSAAPPAGGEENRTGAEPGSEVAGGERSPEASTPAAGGSSQRAAGSSGRDSTTPPAGAGAPGGDLASALPDLPDGSETLPPALAPRLDRLADHLGLGGATRTRFVALQREMFATVLASERQRLRLQAELRRELIGPSPDADRVRELIRRQAELHSAMEAATARAILESRRLLDPEQERRYLAIVAQLGPRLRQEAWRHRRENRPGVRPFPGRRRPR